MFAECLIFPATVLSGCRHTTRYQLRVSDKYWHTRARADVKETVLACVLADCLKQGVRLQGQSVGLLSEWLAAAYRVSRTTTKAALTEMGLSLHWKKVVPVCGHCLVTLSITLPTETLKWLSSLPILMPQKSFWWWQRSDRYIISLSPTSIPPPPPTPLSPSLISRTVLAVDVKHHVYLHMGPCDWPYWWENQWRLNSVHQLPWPEGWQCGTVHRVYSRVFPLRTRVIHDSNKLFNWVMSAARLECKVWFPLRDSQNWSVHGVFVTETDFFFPFSVSPLFVFFLTDAAIPVLSSGWTHLKQVLSLVGTEAFRSSQLECTPAAVGRMWLPWLTHLSLSHTQTHTDTDTHTHCDTAHTHTHTHTHKTPAHVCVCARTRVCARVRHACYTVTHVFSGRYVSGRSWVGREW